MIIHLIRMIVGDGSIGGITIPAKNVALGAGVMEVRNFMHITWFRSREVEDTNSTI